MSASKGELLATLEERVTLSFGGSASAVLLVIFQLVIVTAFSATNGAIQEAVVGTIWTGGNVLFGTCMLMGRRSTYRVLREPESIERPQSPPRATQ